MTIEVLALSTEQAERRDFLRCRAALAKRMPAMFNPLTDAEARELAELDRFALRCKASLIDRRSMAAAGTITVDWPNEVCGPDQRCGSPGCPVCDGPPRKRGNPCCGNIGTHGEGGREYCSTCGAELPS